MIQVPLNSLLHPFKHMSVPSAVLLEAVPKGTPFQVTDSNNASLFNIIVLRCKLHTGNYLPPSLEKRAQLATTASTDRQTRSSDICLVYTSGACPKSDGHVVLVNKGVWSSRWRGISFVGQICG